MPNPELRVEIGAVITDLERNLAKATKDLQKFSDKTVALGKKFQSVGKNMTVGLSLPLALLGGVAVKSFAKFEKELSKIEGLVGIAGDEVAKMGKKANTMASDFGKSGKEAAEALFFITSAGLRGKEAMDVLEASLKASVIGLGETKVVADLATSAMNAYGSEVLSASDATDILTKSVREGKLDAAALGSAMGQVLPIASAMGVTFNEVGATFAAMSRTGTEASVAATQLKGILASLLAPTTEAEKALSAMGLSSEMLRQNIKEKGLLDTLEILNDKFDGNEAAAATVFGSIRALSGVMDLMGKNVDGTRAIFDSLNDSVGATDEAFKSASNTADFKFNKAVKGVTNQLKGFGEVIIETLLPAFEKLAGFLKRTLERFNNLSDGWKKTIVIVGLVVAALGPLLVALGVLMTTVVPGLITVFAFLSGTVLPATIAAFHRLTAAMLANPIGVLIAGISLLVLAFVQVVQKITPAVSKLKTFFNLLKSGGDISKFTTLQLLDQAAAMEEDRIATNKANKELAELKWNEKVAAENAAELTKQLLAQATAAEKVAKALRPKITPVKGQQIGVTDTKTGDEGEIVQIDDISKRVTDAQAATILALHEFNMAASDIINGAIADTFAGLGEAIGSALASGGNVIQAAGGALLGGIGGILVDLGKMAIKIGIGIKAIKLALKTLNPVVAIAAGVALVALGSLFKAGASNIADGIGGGGFAGDTGGGGSRRGTRSSINSVNAASGEQRVIFEVQGTKLIGVIQNTQKRNSAFGGNFNLITG